MTSVSSVAAKESPVQESWITFGRSTHSSSLLKPAIFFSLAGCKCSFTRSSVVYWKWTNSSWRVRSDARTMKARVTLWFTTSCVPRGSNYLLWHTLGHTWWRFMIHSWGCFFPQLNSTRAVRRMARFPCGMSGVYMWWTGRCGMEKKNSTDPPTDIISVIISSGPYMLKISTPLQLFWSCRA